MAWPMAAKTVVRIILLTLTYNEGRFDMALQEIERIIASNGVSPRQRFEDIHSTLHRYEWPPSALRLRDNQ